MERLPMREDLPAERVPIKWRTTFCGKYRVFAMFLICSAVLIAAFAISAVWMERGGREWLDGAIGGLDDTGTTPENLESEREEGTDAPLDPDLPVEIPAGATVITDMDLSAPSLGAAYIHNETPYAPNVNALLEQGVSTNQTENVPVVLILHTHTSEAYLPEGTRYVEGNLGDVTYSRDETQNVLAVGEVLCNTLQQKGITAIHCTVMHDDPTLSGSYLRAAETVNAYLQAYPTIEYVIDLHRDAVTTSDGAFVRAVTEYDGEPVAQVMAVVGSDCNGTRHERWRENLALALQLRAALQQKGEGLCRPVSLRNSSYNQELAEYALILEIGTAANTVEEAKRAAALVGEALANLIYGR